MCRAWLRKKKRETDGRYRGPEGIAIVGPPRANSRPATFPPGSITHPDDRAANGEVSALVGRPSARQAPRTGLRDYPIVSPSIARGYRLRRPVEAADT